MGGQEAKVQRAYRDIESSSALLESRRGTLEAQLLRETNAAIQAYSNGNEKLALRHMQLKRMYETRLDQTYTKTVRLQQQLSAVENTLDDQKLVDALRSSTVAFKSIVNNINLEEVEDLVDDNRELMDDSQRISTAITELISPTESASSTSKKSEKNAAEDASLKDELAKLVAAQQKNATSSTSLTIQQQHQQQQTVSSVNNPIQSAASPVQIFSAVPFSSTLTVATPQTVALTQQPQQQQQLVMESTQQPQHTAVVNSAIGIPPGYDKILM